MSERVWNLSRYWILDPTIDCELAKLISEFWLLNDCRASPEGVWDTFRAYVRGCHQSSISRVQQDAAVTIEEAESRARSLESQYVLTKNLITCLTMQAAYWEVILLRVTKAKKHQLAQTQHIFEQGEKLADS